MANSDADARDGLAEAAKKRVGTSLRGKYLLEALIGVGAMAAVYEGTHRNGMRAAIKVLHPEVSRVTALKSRFLREGYIANRIMHPGVVRVIDDDEDADGTAFVVMELLRGRTLEAEWNACSRKMPLARVARLADTLLEILDAAHAAGVIHRDIKPDNVFWTNDGELKVLDFGIARLIDSSTATPAGQMMGTPEFVAPEQAGGRVKEIDARSDLFSVGAMMFTLLSGELTQIAKTSIEYMIYAATRPPRSIAAVMPSLPSDVAHVIDIALSFEPSGRFASARAMRTALGHATSSLIATPLEKPASNEAAAAPVAPPISSGTQTMGAWLVLRAEESWLTTKLA